MRSLSAALLFLAATPVLAAESGWGTSTDYVNIGDVFGQRWLATQADETGKFRLSYACDQLSAAEGYFVIETPLPRLAEDVTTIPVQIIVEGAPLDFVAYTQVHGNIYYPNLRIGLYQHQQVETVAKLVEALKGGDREVVVTVQDAKAAFASENAARGIAYVEENCRQ